MSQIITKFNKKRSELISNSDVHIWKKLKRNIQFEMYSISNSIIILSLLNKKDNKIQQI